MSEYYNVLYDAIYKDDISSIRCMLIDDEDNLFIIEVSTCDFSGKDHFYMEKEMAKEYIGQIDDMLISLNGEIKICGWGSNAFLKIYFENKLNKYLYVSGQLGGDEYNDNCLKFKLRADQTLLQMLKEAFLKCTS